MTYFQHEAYKWNPQEDQEVIEGIEKIYYENCDPSLFELEVGSGLPRSGKNVRNMKFFPGQGKVREFCRWPGKFRKDLESQGKVREFENR